MSKYRFQKLHNDLEIQRIQREAEDNFALQSDVESKRTKVLDIKKSAPLNNELQDGDEVAFSDGTSVYKYYKIGGRLFKNQLTEV